MNSGSNFAQDEEGYIFVKKYLNYMKGMQREKKKLSDPGGIRTHELAISSSRLQFFS